MRYFLLLISFSLAFSNINAQKTDTITVYFDLAVPALNRVAMQQLDSLAYHNILPPNKKYGIIGYADYLGSDSTNITLSQNRADNVQQYLLGLGVKQDSIAVVTGKGEVHRDIAGDDGYPQDRRVDIVIGGFKNSPATAVRKPVDSMKLLWQVFFEEQTTTKVVFANANNPVKDESVKLKPKQDETIANMCRYLKTNNTYILITGHSIGKSENVLVSLARAEHIRQRLEECGISPDRIKTIAWGLHTSPEYGKPIDYSRRADISISNKPWLAPKTKGVDISKVEKNQSITLDNIFFQPGSHKTTPESVDALFALYITMKDHPNLKINIEGHICCLTNTSHDGYDYDAQEWRLSENRARAVYDYLVSKGIDKSRMRYEGFGLRKPKRWPERSLADENSNRRVEIRILEK